VNPLVPDFILQKDTQNQTSGAFQAAALFVDIAGFTALTDTHGETAAADLVEGFTDLVRRSIEPRGPLQSLIGDCAFLVFPDPVAAVEALASLYAAIADRANFPIIRTGLHHGPALLRKDQHFGTTVNLAARVAAQATGGRILCTRSVADVVAGTPIRNVELRHQGATSLKNLPEPVELFEIVLASLVREYAIDPVCKMQVDTRDAAGDLQFDGKRYWFCSLECVQRFAKRPKSYV
jgi:class 3 adenylate cyclase/YHS domain-containing protein